MDLVWKWKQNTQLWILLEQENKIWRGMGVGSEGIDKGKTSKIKGFLRRQYKDPMQENLPKI